MLRAGHKLCVDKVFVKQNTFYVWTIELQHIVDGSNIQLQCTRCYTDIDLLKHLSHI